MMERSVSRLEGSSTETSDRFVYFCLSENISSENSFRKKKSAQSECSHARVFCIKLCGSNLNAYGV